MKKVFFTILLICSFIYINAAQYYVKNGGSDALAGTSDALAWATLAKVSASSYSPGDTIYLKRGSIWRESLTNPSSGNSGSWITYKNYGTGAKPQILGSNTSTWDDRTGNVWSSASTMTNPKSLYYDANFYCDVLFKETAGTVSWGAYKADTASLAAEYDWTWLGNKIYVYSATDPDSRYSSVEVPQRPTAFYLNEKQYLVIDGIDIHFAAWRGIGNNAGNSDHIHLHGLTIKNCRIGWIGGNRYSASYAQGWGGETIYSDLTYQNDTIHDCGRRGLSMDIYGSGFTTSNVLIESCVFYNGSHTTGIDMSIGNGAYTGSYNGVTIRKNIFYEASNSTISSIQIFLQNYDYAGGARMCNINIYANVFKYPTNAGINMEGCQSVYVYNNTFFEVSSGISTYSTHCWIDANNDTVKVKNNLFYCTATTNNLGYGKALFTLTAANKVDANYNLYYRTSNSLVTVLINSTYYYMNTILTSLRSAGWEANCPTPSNPLFLSSSNLRVQSSSPAKYAGVNLSLPSDYAGNTWNNPPTIGAYEYSYIPLPSATTLDVEDITQHSVNTIGQWEDNGGGTVSRAGMCLATHSNPDITDVIVDSPIDAPGSYECLFTGLKSGTTYHIRYFATNESGTSYGEDLSFTTLNYLQEVNHNGKALFDNSKLIIIR